MHKAASLAGENRNEAARSRGKQGKSMIDRESAWCLLTVFVTMLQTHKLLIR
jgi:hypothetical protein